MKYLAVLIAAGLQIGIGCLALIVGAVNLFGAQGDVDRNLAVAIFGLLLITIGGLCFVVMDIGQNTRKPAA
jgi:hypothetical protein